MYLRPLRAAILAAAVIILLPASALASFSADLTGDQCVPESQSTATGDATFSPRQNETVLETRVKVINLFDDGQTSVSLYLGLPGDPPGMPVARLTVNPPKKTGRYTGILCRVNLTAADLVGELEGRPLSELIARMAAGGVFVNVATSAYPYGEIRGQVY